MNRPDVFVIGAGPAGLAPAIAARQRGLSVLVVDGSRPPIDKACGEGLMPDSRQAAEQLGIELPNSIGFEFRGVRFHAAGRSVEADFPAGKGIGVRRKVLHQAMVDTALRAGVDIRWESPVLGLEETDARWIVGADGSTSRVRRWAGLDARISNSRRFAYRQHFAIAPWTDCMEIYWGAGCQIYITPVGNREICVSSISRRPEMRLQDALNRHFPELQERLAARFATSRERGALTVTMRLRSVARRNVALIGDASGSVDAITGEGLCLSFKQAILLADAMANGDLSAYDRAHPSLALRPFIMSKTMLLLDRGPAIRHVAMGAMAWQPRIFGALLAVHVA
jgi:flavin-dependent dehydrogenase